jgi:sugar phosphate isomerase/epimerase
VADIGYKGVEFAGLHGMPAEEVRKILDDLGLVACSAHGGHPAPGTAQQIIDECRALGHKRLVSGPGGPISSMPEISASARKLNDAVSALAGSGIEFGLHNHWAEFEPVGGVLPEDVLLQEVPGLFAEIDVYWVAVGGPDPAATVARLKHRAPLLHIKDGFVNPPQPHTAVGAGKLDMQSIIAAADPDVCEWLIVELDSCSPRTCMWQAVMDSYYHLTDNGLAEGSR